MKNQWRSYSELRQDQDSQLRRMINYAYYNVPYYHKVFRDLNLRLDEIREVSDLEKLPILTKEIIKKNWDKFKPLNLNKIQYYKQSTGGSTGTPLVYRLEKFDRFLSGALMYRRWGYAGYELGDKMVFLAGASLGIGAKSNITTKVHEIARNIRMLSSFDMSEAEMSRYVKIINSYEPKFIRGYASSIYFLSRWIERKDLLVYKPLAIFTTAEKLYPHMREVIERVFDCKVYDGYGLNDGGITACECSEHLGLHIDMERSVMEIVDKEGNQLEDGEGTILATSLYNYAMPFIRYDTGDIGSIISEKCNCGRDYKLLRSITGRQQEMLLTPEGKYIHGEFFTHIFWEINNVKEFQIIQKSLNKIAIKIVPEDNFNIEQLDQIRQDIRKRSERWDIEFEFIDKIEKTGAGKYKFVSSEYDN